MSDRQLHRALCAAALGTAVACGSNDAGTPPTGVTGTPITTGSTLGVGSSLGVGAGASVTLAGGTTGGEYVLVVADTTSASSAASSYQLTTSGISAPGTVSSPSNSISPLASRAVTPATPTLDYSAAVRLNVRARPRLLPLFASARSVRAASSGLLRSTAAATPAVGDIINYNVSQNGCDSLVIHASRVVAVGSKAIIAVDTLNPSGGFTASDYARFAANFDTLVYPLDVNNFGTPSDIDGNGHVVLLFTRAVNEMTPAHSGSFVGGFFFERDLFPHTATSTLSACAGSNIAEMFYLLSPDPSGAVNGNTRTAGFVDTLITGIVAHEFQHLINASRRIYVNNASTFEVVWLNEGLSHIAEELLFYRQSAGLAPRQDISANTLRASAQSVAAFNMDQVSNAGRYAVYLGSPSTNSPIRNDDSLGTRGATWDLLRYLSDRKVRSAGTTDAANWQALVNSQVNGVANLRAVFGSDIGGPLRDWSVSHYTDDFVAGASVDLMQDSWAWRTIYPALGTNNTYPLAINSLTSAGASGSVIPGGSVFYRFAVAANASGTVGITAPNAPLAGVVVRIR